MLKRGLVLVLPAAIALQACGSASTATALPTERPLPTAAAEAASTPTRSPTPRATATPAISVGELVLPDPRHTNPELFEHADPETGIPQFVAAMQMAGIGITAAQVVEGITYEAFTDADGGPFVVGLYRLDPDLLREGEPLEGGVPLLIAKRDGIRWRWGRAYLRDVAEPIGVTLRVLFGFGAERTQELLREIALRNFSAMTISYDWPVLEPSQGVYNPEWPDYQVLTARGRVSGFTLHHLLPSHEDLIPQWVDRRMEADRARQVIEDHIRWLVRHYRQMNGGRLDNWVLVVVNEAMAAEVRGFGDVFADVLGPEYIDYAFEVARREAPEAVLIYNDSNNHGSQGVSTQDGLTTSLTMQIAERLRARGLIDGVGLEMHLAEGRMPNMQDVAETIHAYQALGLQVFVTEFDVILSNAAGSQERRLLYQADIAQRVIRGLLEAGVEDIGVWDLTDAGAWAQYPRSDPTLFDDQGNPKPNYYAFLMELARAALRLR